MSVSSSVYRGGAWVACSTLRSAVAACPHALLRGDAPNLAHILLGEPEVAIRPGCDALRSALGRGDTEPGEAAAGRDAPDGVADGFREPEVAIRPGCDAMRRAGTIGPTDRYQAELGDAATGGDAPDLVPILLGEPEVAIRPGCDAIQAATINGRTGRWQGELGDAARGGDAPNLAPIKFREPEVAIRPGRDADGEATLRLDVELGDGPTGGDASDLVPTGVGKPEVAIRPGGDAPSAIGRGEQGDAATGGDAPDLARAITCEPEIAIRPGGDAERAIGHGELGDAATGGDAPDLARAIREPEVAIRPGGDVERRALRRDGVLGDGACCGPDGSAAQAQQTDTGNYGGEKCGQVRPPSRTIHGSFSFIGVATHRYQEDVSSSLQPGVWAAGQRPGAEPAARVGTAGSKVSAPRMSTIGPVNKRERTNVGSTWASQSFLQAHQPCNQDRFTRLKICSTICFSSSERK